MGGVTLKIHVSLLFYMLGSMALPFLVLKKKPPYKTLAISNFMGCTCLLHNTWFCSFKSVFSSNIFTLPGHLRVKIHDLFSCPFDIAPFTRKKKGKSSDYMLTGLGGCCW